MGQLPTVTNVGNWKLKYVDESGLSSLEPLQDIKTRIASQTSIAHILYLQEQGGDAMDRLGLGHAVRLRALRGRD